MCLGIPSLVLAVFDGPLPMARVDTAGLQQDCTLVYHPEVGVGDWVLVQHGFVINVLDEQSAAQSWAAFAELGVLPPWPEHEPRSAAGGLQLGST